MTALLMLKRWLPAIAIGLLLVAIAIKGAELARVRATLDRERAAWSAERHQAEKARLAAERRFAERGAAAALAYADRLAAREPIILRSTDTVRTYAQTDAGRAPCLGPDRVRGIDNLDAELAEDPGPAPGGAGAVHRDADAPPG